MFHCGKRKYNKRTINSAYWEPWRCRRLSCHGASRRGVPPIFFVLFGCSRCGDDRSVFEFSNKATVHFWFANVEKNKSIQKAFQAFGTSPKDYDVIVANAGNDPKLPISRLVNSARNFHSTGVRFLWLTTYHGDGDILKWKDTERQAFEQASGVYLPVHDMMKSVARFTRGRVEGGGDGHFCLPGPPNELGTLVLRLLWALHEERDGA